MAKSKEGTEPKASFSINPIESVLALTFGVGLLYSGAHFFAQREDFTFRALAHRSPFETGATQRQIASAPKDQDSWRQKEPTFDFEPAEAQNSKESTQESTED